jgi:hypothetical protein
VVARLVRQVTGRRDPLGGIDEATLSTIGQALANPPYTIVVDRGDVMEAAEEAGETHD